MPSRNMGKGKDDGKVAEGREKVMLALSCLNSRFMNTVRFGTQV